jgi:hypothetical protein
LNTYTNITATKAKPFPDGKQTSSFRASPPRQSGGPQLASGRLGCDRRHRRRRPPATPAPSWAPLHKVTLMRSSLSTLTRLGRAAHKGTAVTGAAVSAVAVAETVVTPGRGGGPSWACRWATLREVALMRSSLSTLTPSAKAARAWRRPHQRHRRRRGVGRAGRAHLAAVVVRCGRRGTGHEGV